MHEERYKELKKYIDKEVVVKFICSGYACQKYRVDKNEAHLSDEDLAIICDKGNLPFGFRREGNIIVVYID